MRGLVEQVLQVPPQTPQTPQIRGRGSRPIGVGVALVRTPACRGVLVWISIVIATIPLGPGL